MTVGVDQLTEVQRVACERVSTDLSDSAGQPIITFCHELVGWIVRGDGRPTGTPTNRVRSAVRAAVNVGLRAVYGDENFAGIDDGILTRRNSL